MHLRFFPAGNPSFLNTVRVSEAPKTGVSRFPVQLSLPPDLLHSLSQLVDELAGANRLSGAGQIADELIGLLNTQELSLPQLLPASLLSKQGVQNVENLSQTELWTLLAKVEFLLRRYEDAESSEALSEPERQTQLLELTRQLSRFLDEKIIRHLTKTPVWYLKWLMEIQSEKQREYQRSLDEQPLMGRSLPHGVSLPEATVALGEEEPGLHMRHAADLLALLAADGPSPMLAQPPQN
ncbi:MAG: hypothetical protein ACO1RX_01330 [Candidatus Sericytochromatia bacterium]